MDWKDEKKHQMQEETPTFCGYLFFEGNLDEHKRQRVKKYSPGVLPDRRRHGIVEQRSDRVTRWTASPNLQKKGGGAHDRV